MQQTDGKITLHIPGEKFLRFLCKHQLSLHFNLSGLEGWVVLPYICEMFGYWSTTYFDTGSGPTDQRYCWVCLRIQTVGSKQREDNWKMSDCFVASEGSITKEEFQTLGLQHSRKSHMLKGKDFMFGSIKQNLLSYFSGSFRAQQRRHVPGINRGFCSRTQSPLWGQLRAISQAAAAAAAQVSTSPQSSCVICEGSKAPALEAEQPLLKAAVGTHTQSTVGGHIRCQNALWHLRGDRGPPAPQSSCSEGHQEGGETLEHLAQSSAIPGTCEHSMAGQGTPWPQPCVEAHERKTARLWHPNLAARRPGHPLPQAASPALLQPCDGTQGQEEDMTLCGMGKLRTSQPWCPRHTFHERHHSPSSQTEWVFHWCQPKPQKQRGLCYQTRCFEGLITRGEPQSIFFLETGAFPMPPLLRVLLTVLLLTLPSSGASLLQGSPVITAFAISHRQPSQSTQPFRGYPSF